MAEEDLIFGKNRHFFGGIEPSNMRKFTASIVDGTVKLDMQLPKDTVVNGHTLCSVAGAVVRRKTDGYPINEFDGELVGDYSVEYLNEQYAESGGYLIDEGAEFGGDNLFVATGSNGLWYSEDGKTWTQSNVTSGTFYTLYYADGVWATGGSSNGLWYSEDGKTWIQSNITSCSLNDIYHANGMWVACTSAGPYYSTDGKTWDYSNNMGRSFWAVHYDDDLWVSGCYGKGLYYSEDGETWTQSNVTSGDTNDIYHANGMWVACTSKGLYYSIDGKTWIKCNISITSSTFDAVYYANGVWVMSDAGSSYGLYYSEDGINWANSNITSGGIDDIQYGNGIWIAGGATSRNSILYSEDGKTWTQSNITSGKFNDIYYNNGSWIACSNDKLGLYYSEDGKTWTQSNITSGTYKYIGSTRFDSSASEYYYSAFPYTTQGVYNISPVNRAYVSASGPSDPSNPDIPSDPVTGSYFYGYDLDLNDSDPATRVSYPEEVDNANFTPVKMGTSSFSYGSWNIAPGEQFMPKPCALKLDGTVEYYLNPNNYAKKEDGTDSTISYNSNLGLNAMMEWSKIYTKRWEENGVYHFRCSDRKVDDSYECWCNYDINNNEIDHFYTAIYQGVRGTTTIDGNYGTYLMSVSGYKDNNHYTIDDAFDAAAMNGDDWTVDTLADRLLIQDLLVMIGKSTDGQAVYGKGVAGTNGVIISGSCDDKGLFWGDIVESQSCVKVFGMEHWWGNSERYLAGLVRNNTSVKYKITRGKKDGTNTTNYNTNGNAYLYLGTGTISSTGKIDITDGFINSMRTESYGRLPFGGTGSSTTYECDYIRKYVGDSSILHARVGGTYANGDYCGPFTVSFRIDDGTSSYLAVGCLACKPSAK